MLFYLNFYYFGLLGLTTSKLWPVSLIYVWPIDIVASWSGVTTGVNGGVGLLIAEVFAFCLLSCVLTTCLYKDEVVEIIPTITNVILTDFKPSLSYCLETFTSPSGITSK